VLKFIREGLRNTDERVKLDKPITPMFLYAVFLWHPINALAAKLREDGWNEPQAMLEASSRIVAGQQTSFPRRFSSPMKELLAMQWRFANTQGVRAQRLLEHKRFRAAYDFFVLRARCGEVDQTLADWWTNVQELPPDDQQKAFGGRQRRGNRRRRGGRRRSNGPEVDFAG
jgi:poly(A) polymerase